MRYKSESVWSVATDINSATFTTIDGDVNAYHVHLSMQSAGVKRKTFDYPGADGGEDKGYSLDPMRMVWELFVQADTEAAYEAKRENIYRLFKPYDSGIKIRCDLVSFGPLREIDAYVDGPVEFLQSKQLGFSSLVRVPLYVPTSLWHGTTQAQATSSLPGTGVSFHYSGNYPEYPVVEIDGQVTDLTITATITTAYRSETSVISFVGTTIPNGEKWIVDPRTGIKEVYRTSPSTLDKGATMADPSWVNFRLWPEPLKAGGTNLINYAYTSKNANAFMRIKFYNRYLGY